jgi:hypothetical protein
MDTLKKPPVMIALSIFVGIILGLVYAYQIDRIQWIDQPMTWTREDLQENYLRMALDSFRVTGDEQGVLARYNDLGPNAPVVLEKLKTNPDTDQGVIAVFEDVLKNNPSAEPTPAPDGGGQAAGIPMALIWGSVIALLLILGVAGFLVFRYLFRSNSRAPEDMTPAMLAAEHSRSVEKTDYSTTGEQPPVAQYVTTYVLGDDLFDDSFSIDAPSGEFLGECGVGISETVGVGDPKKVAAFEVWMFDKNDIQTVTKVLMSAHAFADPAFRAKLEPKGELVQVDPHKQIVLETQTLQMIATISDMQYGQGALPDGSYFDRVTIELAIWSKK